MRTHIRYSDTLISRVQCITSTQAPKRLHPGFPVQCIRTRKGSSAARRDGVSQMKPDNASRSHRQRFRSPL